MSLSFLVKIQCYLRRPFTITLASSAIIRAGRFLILRCQSPSEKPPCVKLNIKRGTTETLT